MRPTFFQQIRSYFLFALVGLLGTTPALSQHVETRDSGGGTKLELHYSAEGQVTETRTIGADGKLLEKNALEYPAGAYVPNSIATSYWPNGQVHQVARNTYDNNSNFTGEVIQIFNDTGKQIGGHRLTHDPQTNVYTCARWDTGANAYKPEECPAGEESGGGSETVKKFTADEVMQQLARARQPAPPRRNTAPPVTASTPNNVKEVGLVLPAHIRPGERISGSVVEGPGDYENTPEVMVTRFELPGAASGSSAKLSAWQVEISGEPPQPADGPMALTVPPGQVELAVLLRQADNTGTPVSKLVKLGGAGSAKNAPSEKKKLTSYMAPALCVKGQLCIVRGPFNGNSAKTFAAFEMRPAKIIAETSTALYLAIPDATEPGPRPLAIAEGTKAIAFPMVVAEFSIRPDRRDLPKGEKQLMYPMVEGGGDLPDAEWQPGNFPASNLELARKLVPGFQPPSAPSAHEKREAEERREKEKSAATQGGAAGKAESDEGEGGELLLVIKNLTPDVANFRDSKDGMYVFHLNAAAFKQGDFKYKFVVEAKQAGNFGVQAWLIPFLAPVKGQEFPISAAAK